MPTMRHVSDKELTGVIVERIRERLADLGLTAQQASKNAGIGASGIGDILLGRVKNPGTPLLAAIARALECDVAFLLGEIDSPKVSDGLTGLIPVVGTVEAGVFTEMSGAEPWLEEEDFETIRAPHDRRYPRARHFAWKVRGDSMNSARPRPILEGDYLLCVDFADSGLSISDNRIYVIRRTRNAGQSYEWTVKRARVYRDRVELVPESTNPKHQVQIIHTRKSQSDEDGEQIDVIGLVYGTFAKMDGD